ncbi:MAG: ferredoxin-NADP reductase [Oceanicoccus sp.]|jgi:ferredoxin-NADP reductase
MQEISCPLRVIKKLTDNVWEFDFGFENVPVDFKPGQFFILKVPGEKSVNRSYSVASVPSKGGFKLCIKLIPDGLGSEYLRNFKIGDHAQFMAPAGHFTLQESTKEVIMISTGTGLAPFISMLPIMFERGDSQPITLYFGCRHESDLFYLKQLKKWEEAHDNFTAVVCVSQAEDSWEGFHGRVTAALENHPFDAEDTKVYICGNGNMVKDVRAMMLEKGITKQDLHFELFTPIT